MKKVSPYLWKLAWVVGLFFLIIICSEIDTLSTKGLTMQHPILANLLIHFIWGIYLSLILIKKWTFQINTPLLICVFLPCFLFSLILPVDAFTPLNFNFSTWIKWYISLISSGLIEIVAGLTLMLSIFNTKKSASN